MCISVGDPFQLLQLSRGTSAAETPAIAAILNLA
jgi:hypothetical protein